MQPRGSAAGEASARPSKTALGGRWDVAAAGELCGGPEIILDFPDCECAAVQVASDLHLEFVRQGCGHNTGDWVVPSAPILALLGDIGIPSHPSYRDFLLQQADRFAAVLVLTGNHEFYSVNHAPTPPPLEGQTYSEVTALEARTKHSCEDMESAIEEICGERPNLHYVDNRTVRLGRKPDAPALLCTPLWSHVPADAIGHVGRSLNDYHMCWVRPRFATAADAEEFASRGGVHNAKGIPLRKLTPADTSAWHALAVGWIAREMTRLRGADVKRAALLTHHTPSMSGTSHPRFEGENANATQHGFSTDLSELYGGALELIAWVYGHTHYNNERMHLGTRLLSNQRGYVHQVDEGYKPTLRLDLETGRVIV